MKTKIVCLVGISGSGKSTRALEICSTQPNCRILNRDYLREILTGYSEQDIHLYYAGGDINPSEYLITKFLEGQIRHTCPQTELIVIDNTNLSKRYLNQFESLAKELNFDFEVEVLHTPLEECIQRDSLRKRQVGEKVIREQYKKFIDLYDKI